MYAVRLDWRPDRHENLRDVVSGPWVFLLNVEVFWLTYEAELVNLEPEVVPINTHLKLNMDRLHLSSAA